MNKHLLSGLLVITLFSCHRSTSSDIEVIRFDTRIIDTLKQRSDTTYTEVKGRKDYYTIDHYINRKNNTTAQILKDSLGHVVGFNESKNGEMLFSGEYYKNGQLMGKTQFVAGKVDGQATYYYPDGRIRSVGQWRDYRQTGIWKNYNEQGTLEKIIYYDENGNVAKTELIQQ